MSKEPLTVQSDSRIVQTAIKFGLIKPGWTLENYISEAVEKQGYATVQVWGEQGSGKSNRILQQGYWVYKDWDLVLKNIIFKPSSFVQRLKAIPKGKRVPWIGWDDVGVWFTSNAFRTDITQYEAVDGAWASIRVKCSVISLTIPNISRLARNIKDNVSHEVYLGKNQMEMVERIVRLPSFTSLESELFKVLIEGPRLFRLFNVPRDVFKEYWEMRLQLTEEALEKMDQSTEPESPEGFIPVLEAAKISKEKGVRYSTSSIQQDISRGVIRGTKIGPVLYVWEEDFQTNLELKE